MKNTPSEHSGAHRGIPKRRNVGRGEDPDGVRPRAEVKYAAVAPAGVQHAGDLEEAVEDEPGRVESCERFAGAAEEDGWCLATCEVTGVAWIRRGRRRKMERRREGRQDARGDKEYPRDGGDRCVH
jgi:hypothetical protein